MMKKILAGVVVLLFLALLGYRSAAGETIRSGRLKTACRSKS